MDTFERPLKVLRIRSLYLLGKSTLVLELKRKGMESKSLKAEQLLLSAGIQVVDNHGMMQVLGMHADLVGSSRLGLRFDEHDILIPHLCSLDNAKEGNRRLELATSFLSVVK